MTPRCRASRWSISGSSTTAVDALGAASLEDAADLRRARVEHRPHQVVASRGRGDRERSAAVGERDEHQACLDQLPHPPGDEIEQRLELDLRRERGPDLAEALELAQPPGRRLVQPRVLDRHRRLGGEQAGQLLVLGREVRAARLLGEVEVAEGDAAEHDRHAEERPHRRVVRREAGRAGVLRDVVQPERPRFPDQRPEQAPPARQVADRLVGLLVDPRGEEPLQSLSRRVDHAERRVARLGQLRGDLGQALEERIERQLGRQRDPGLDEPPEPVRLRGRHRTSVVRCLHVPFLAASTRRSPALSGRARHPGEAHDAG